MKKLLFTLSLVLASSFALAGPDDIVFTKRNSTDSGQGPVIPTHPSSPGLMYYDSASKLPDYVLPGNCLSIGSGSISVNGNCVFSGAFSDLTGKPTTLTGYGITDAYPLAGNPSSFLTGITSTQVTNALGFTPYNATNPSAYINLSGARGGLSLTTTGTSGAATYNSSNGTLNIPDYAPGSGTVTSVTCGTGLTGGTITSTGTCALSSVGTAGTYSGVTTDAQGRVTAGTTLSINDSPSRSLVTSTSATGYQISSTRNARGCYEGAFSTTSTIGGPSSASVFLETADTNSTTPSDWTTKATQTYSNTITLAIVLNQVQGNNWSFCRDIPFGKFVRLRSGSISGTASASLNATQQETLY